MAQGKEKPRLLVIYNILKLNSIVVYGNYCGLFQCAKGPQDVGFVKKRSFTSQQTNRSSVNTSISLSSVSLRLNTEWTFEAFRLRDGKLSCSVLRGLEGGKNPWQACLLFIEKSHKMLRGYPQKDHKMLGKISL